MRMKKKISPAVLGGIVAASLLGTTSSAVAKSPIYTFAMITHGQPGDTFWDIIRKGAEAAAKQDHVKLIYYSNPNAAGEAQLITNVTEQHVAGIAATLAFPEAEEPAIKAAEKAGIPVVGFNAGTRYWKKAGMLMYVGENDYIAGEAVGDRLNKEGAKDVVCVDQQQGAIQLTNRCDGIKKTFKGKLSTLYVDGYDMASAQSRMVAKLQQNPKIDYIVTLGAPFAPTAVQAVQLANSKAKVGTFDMNPRAVHLMEEGKVQWSVDQQPYLQGYEAVNFLWLYKTNHDIVGAGMPIATGPNFVTAKNVREIAPFVNRGTR